MTFIVWMDSGKWVPVSADSEEDVLRKLTRIQRKHVTKIKEVVWG